MMDQTVPINLKRVPFASYEILENGNLSPARVMTRVARQEELVSEDQFFYEQGFMFGPFDDHGGKRQRIVSTSIGLSV